MRYKYNRDSLKQHSWIINENQMPDLAFMYKQKDAELKHHRLETPDQTKILMEENIKQLIKYQQQAAKVAKTLSQIQYREKIMQNGVEDVIDLIEAINTEAMDAKGAYQISSNAYYKAYGNTESLNNIQSRIKDQVDAYTKAKANLVHAQLVHANDDKQLKLAQIMISHQQLYNRARVEYDNNLFLARMYVNMLTSGTLRITHKVDKMKSNCKKLMLMYKDYAFEPHRISDVERILLLKEVTSGRLITDDH